MQYFDYESVAREAGIPPDTLAVWRQLFESQYHGDQMMVELRLLRACWSASRSPQALEAVTKALADEMAAERAQRT